MPSRNLKNCGPETPKRQSDFCAAVGLYVQELVFVQSRRGSRRAIHLCFLNPNPHHLHHSLSLFTPHFSLYYSSPCLPSSASAPISATATVGSIKRCSSYPAPPGISSVRTSTWHGTTPIGGPEGQLDFLNGARPHRNFSLRETTPRAPPRNRNPTRPRPPPTLGPAHR